MIKQEFDKWKENEAKMYSTKTNHYRNNSDEQFYTFQAGADAVYNLLSKEIGEKDEEIKELRDINEGLRLSRNEYMNAFDNRASQFPSQGLKWVNLPELPKKKHNYHVKMLSPKNSVIKEYVWNSTCLFDGEKFVDDVNRGELLNGNTVVAWLDESAPSQGLREEERKLLKSWLEIYKKYANDNPEDDMLVDETESVLKKQTGIIPDALIVKKAHEAWDTLPEVFTDEWDFTTFCFGFRKGLLPQTPTPDGSQGLREALEEIVEIKNAPPYGDSLPNRYYKICDIATEALKK